MLPTGTAGARPGRAVAALGNAFTGWGSVTDAVAPGAGVSGAVAAPAVAAVAAGAAPMKVVKVCMSCVAAAGSAASCCRNGSPGTVGAGAGAGWAAAEALSASAAETAPAAAIIVVAIVFLVLCMVLPKFVMAVTAQLARLNPKLARYQSYSRDTCGVYSTVTVVKANGDRSLESYG